MAFGRHRTADSKPFGGTYRPEQTQRMTIILQEHHCHALGKLLERYRLFQEQSVLYRRRTSLMTQAIHLSYTAQWATDSAPYHIPTPSFWHDYTCLLSTSVNAVLATWKLVRDHGRPHGSALRKVDRYQVLA